ncbi:hypothetical protein SmJEL517_g00473 [Synchytrium microbalum]|uniref:Ribosomal RNA-processing protein 8 n=1 Tax=Synchytrium microbalum TaxID=1806994 RepID=A0A507CHL6_9FUNG|nr:uncharacterized protein SmJEL517_g00473 [Synchytrium microbalum]TPX37586.1 hypothetical protein SmJEL517_g00473 [Synchytrium microbalum]
MTTSPPNFGALWTGDAPLKMKRPATSEPKAERPKKKIRSEPPAPEPEVKVAPVIVAQVKRPVTLKDKLKQALDKSKSRAVAASKVSNPYSSSKASQVNKKGGVNTTAKHPKLQPQPTTSTQTRPTPAAPSNKHAKKLAGAEFRWINEQLYTTTSYDAVDLFKTQPNMFDVYHQGFRSQVTTWPLNPINVIIASCSKLPKTTIIADLGCGDAQLAQDLSHDYKVHSFDLVSKNKHVVACDIAHVPLKDGSVDVVVICLALMGTNWADFVKEAVRILRKGGMLKIAEVTSRFVNVDDFVEYLTASLGLKLKSQDVSNPMFILFDFVKKTEASAEVEDKSSLLKPCVYKRR